MWTALSLCILVAAGTAAYAVWAVEIAATGVPVWLLIAGAPIAYFAVIAVLTLLYFTASWLLRAKRPRDVQIGIAQTLALVWNEYRALTRSVRMVLYLLETRDPSPAPAPVPVLLVHGVLCNAGVWAGFARYLERNGAGPVYMLSYGPPLASIEAFAEQLSGKIDAIRRCTGAASVVIVSHSMGGLVSLAYCRRHGRAAVRRLIAIGAPFHGSFLAWAFPGACLAQIRPGSAWLRDLQRDTFERPTIHSLWSWHDSMVAPQTSSVLPDAVNVEHVGIGHNALLAEPAIRARTLALVLEARANATSGSPA